MAPRLRSMLFQVLATGLGGLFLALGLWLSGGLDRWEYRTWDVRAAGLASPGPATSDISLILLDQQSLDWGQKYSGLSWPWPREVYGAIVDFCRRAQARSLAIDVLFLEPSAYGVGDDQVLAGSLEDFGSTALAAFVSRAGTGGVPSWPGNIPGPSWNMSPELKAFFDSHDQPGTRLSPPLEILARSAAVLANVRSEPDKDGVFRRMRPADAFDGQILPGLGLGAYLAWKPDSRWSLEKKGLSLDRLDIPVDRDGRAILRFRGPSGTHQAYSAAAVLQSEILMRQGLDPDLDPAVFRDRHVFFGFSAPGLFDLRPTPVGGVYPGVEIQATFLDNLLSRDFMRKMPASLTLVLLTGLCLLTALAMAVWKSPLTGTFLALGLLLLPLGLSVLAYIQGWWMPLVVQETGVGTAALLGLLYNYSTEGRQKRFIKNAFRQYLSPHVVEQLIAHPEKLKLGGERKTLSIFFSDLQGFTSISEKMDPEDLTSLLNDFLSAMTEIIQAEGGTVDKYEGDAIIAFWNAPLDVPDHGLRAVSAALKCQAALDRMRPAFKKRSGHDLRMRVGINTGPAVVGNLGSKTRFDYSMLGDAVNLAARLEGLNKKFGTFTMISESTRQAAGDSVLTRELGRVAVVGRGEPVTVFEPMSGEAAAAGAEKLEKFALGLKMFYAGDLAGAEKIFSSLANQDPAAAAYLDRCRLEKDAAGRDWDGVWRMTTK